MYLGALRNLPPAPRPRPVRAMPTWTTTATRQPPMEEVRNATQPGRQHFQQVQKNIVAERAQLEKTGALHSRKAIEDAKFALVQENIKKQREEMRQTQPHGLTPSSRWSSYSGKPLPEGTQLDPKLAAALAMGKGVIARWSPEKQLWISSI